MLFSVEGFAKKYIGYFYRKTYREEKKNIQLLYNDKYNSAYRISAILEGSGIRVSDLTELDKPSKMRCLVVESGSEHSITATDVAEYFGCILKKGDTGIYDMPPYIPIRSLTFHFNHGSVYSISVRLMTMVLDILLNKRCLLF